MKLKYILAVMLLVLILIPFQAQAQSQDDMTTYTNMVYRAEYENMSVVLIAPENGAPMAPEQIVPVKIIVLWKGAQGNYSLLLKHNAVTEGTYTLEDYYEPDVVVKGDASDNIYLMVQNHDVSQILELEDPSGMKFQRLSYVLTLDEPSTQSNPYYEQYIDQQRAEADEAIMEAERLIVEENPLKTPIYIIGVVFIMAIMFVLAIKLAVYNKKHELEDSVANKTNGIVLTASIITIALALAFTIIKVSNPATTRNEFLTTFAYFGLITTGVIVFIIIYLWAYIKEKIPGLEMISWLQQRADGKFNLMGVMARRYTNEFGERCIAIKTGRDKSWVDRMKDRDTLFRVDGMNEKDLESPVYWQGKYPMMFVDPNWKMTRENVMDVINEAKKKAIKMGKAPTKVASKDMNRFYKRGMKFRQIFTIIPAAIYHRGLPYFVSLWDYFAQENHNREAMARDRMIDVLMKLIKFKKRYDASGQLVEMFGRSPFDTTENRVEFERLLNVVEGDLSTHERMADKEAKLMSEVGEAQIGV